MTIKELEQLIELQNRIKYYEQILKALDNECALNSDCAIMVSAYNQCKPSKDPELAADLRKYATENLKKYKEQLNQVCISTYRPACPIGYTDCVNDPAYVACYHPDWYKELYGDHTIGEAIQQRCTKVMCLHDTEQR